MSFWNKPVTIIVFLKLNGQGTENPKSEKNKKQFTLEIYHELMIWVLHENLIIKFYAIKRISMQPDSARCPYKCTIFYNKIAQMSISLPSKKIPMISNDRGMVISCHS